MPKTCNRCGQEKEIGGDELGLAMANFVCMDCRRCADFQIGDFYRKHENGIPHLMHDIANDMPSNDAN